MKEFSIDDYVKERGDILNRINRRIFIHKSIIIEDFEMELSDDFEVDMDDIHCSNSREEISYHVGCIKALNEVKQFMKA